MAMSLREMISYPEEYHIYGNNNFYRTGPARLRSPDIIRTLDVPVLTTVGFTFGVPTDDVRPRFTPRDGVLGSISAEFLANMRIVQVAEKRNPDGHIWMKFCLQHNTTREVLFLATSNYLPAEASVPAVADGWFVFKSDIVAPGQFWANVKVALA